MKRNNTIRKEEGSSLVEALIALAILMVVLVPAATSIIYLANNRIAEEKIEGFIVARNQIEQMISAKNDSSIVLQIDDDWWVKRIVQNEEDLYHLKIEVFKRDTLKPPTVILETSRLWYKEK